MIWSSNVAPRAAEVEASLPGDGLVPDPDVVMDRAFTVPSSPPVVWPWLVQLGKRRAGWYLPRRIERLIPPRRRAVRHVEPAWQGLRVGDVIPDYGGADETFIVAVLDPPRSLVYRSRRRTVEVSWSISLSEAPGQLAPPAGTRPSSGGTRIHLRLRLGPVRRVWLAESVGGLFDLLTIAGLAAGLRERLIEQPDS